MKVHDSSQSLGRGTESPAYFARPLWPYRGRPRLFETACEAWSDSRVRLSISEQSIVFPIRENLENQNQSASSRSGLDRVDAAVREWQLKAPSVRERRRKATTRRELRWNPILRNLVPSENVLLQARDPPLKLFPLLGLKLLFAGMRTRSHSDLARGEPRQISGPPTPPRPSRTRARRLAST